MNILISGNPTAGLAGSLYKLYPDANFVSRSSTGSDLTAGESQRAFAELATKQDVVIICAALWKFQQTVLLDEVHKACVDANVAPHIICIGSTTDRVKNGKTWRYNAEKKALRDYANTCSIQGVWGENKPKVSYISFGTLSNNQHKHPERKCLDIDVAAEYVAWLINQPRNMNINEISIDPMQGDNWIR
jgi:hypothetical protein